MYTPLCSSTEPRSESSESTAANTYTLPAVKVNLRLKKLREENKIPQRKLASMLYCCQQSYSRYENGVAEPPLTVLIQLSRLYGTSVDYIIGASDRRRA